MAGPDLARGRGEREVEAAEAGHAHRAADLQRGRDDAADLRGIVGAHRGGQVSEQRREPGAETESAEAEQHDEHHVARPSG